MKIQEGNHFTLEKTFITASCSVTGLNWQMQARIGQKWPKKAKNGQNTHLEAIFCCLLELYERKAIMHLCKGLSLWLHVLTIHIRGGRWSKLSKIG